MNGPEGFRPEYFLVNGVERSSAEAAAAAEGAGQITDDELMMAKSVIKATMEQYRSTDDKPMETHFGPRGLRSKFEFEYGE